MGAYLKPLSVVVALLALLTAVWWQSRGPDAALETRLHEALFAFEVSDTALNRDVLLARAGLLRRYDSLAQGRHDLRRALRALRATDAGGAEFVASDGALEHLETALAEKTALVDYFKSDNALLRNSLMYFNTAGQALRGAALAASETGLAAEVGVLSHAMLRYMEAPQAHVGQEIKAILDRLPPAPASFRADLNLLVIHGRLIVDFLPRADGLLRQIVDAPTAAGVRALRDRVNGHFGRAQARAGLFRLLLYGIAVLLLGYLIHLFARLQLNARNLRRANADLQREMAERRQVEAALRESEQRLRHSQKMEAVGTLAGGIAHEFNNFLAPILGYTELVLAGLPRDSRPRQQLEKVLAAAKRARAVVGKILTFSRRGESARKPVELQRVASEAVQLLRASLPATIAIDESLRVENGWVEADADQLQQVIINLGANAAHAMSDGGTITVRLEPATVELPADADLPRLKPGRYLRLSLSDTGCGMDAATQARIFEPFFTTKETGKGTGLGLAIVHGIVSDHGGAIEVASAPGQGSTFTVLLPRAEAGSGADLGEEPAVALGRGETVLFVDDEPALVELGEAMLAALGFKGIGVAGGQRALVAFRAAPRRFDLVITDQVMADMSGLELAAAIRRLRPDIPIALASGRSDARLTEQARQHGIQEILKKPLLSRELNECAARALARTPAGVSRKPPESGGR
jgi:signal transduction histidine kinase/ActR/RegA family two-component response regulator